MVNEKENVAASNAQITAKKNRRGVSNKTKSVAQLKFHEKDAAQNGLFIGHLESASVEWSTNNEAKVFPGLAVPRIQLHFASNHTNTSEQRNVYKNINPVESNVNTIEGGKDEWQVNNVFGWIKHILDVLYLKGRDMTEEEEDLLTLPFSDIDDNGNYVPLEPEEVLKGYQYIFTNVVNMLNGNINLSDGETAKPCYKTADGKYIPLWMKLLRHKKVRNEWRDVAPNGELGFDNLLGNGVIEILKRDTAPAILRIDLSKESITPKETKKQPSVGVSGLGVNPIGGVAVNPSAFNNLSSVGDGEAFAAADSDMPF